MKKSLVFYFIFFFPLIILAQHQISGKVIDLAGHPILDVAVKVKKLSVLTSTDSLGRFKIFATVGRILHFKKKGFINKSFTVKEKHRNELEIVLKQKNNLEKTVLIKGKVMDYETEEPFIGASILIKGSLIVTLTNFEGEFELKVPKGSEIEVSINCFGENPNFIAKKSGYHEILVGQYENVFQKPSTQFLINQANFNRGNIHHPLQLIQGKVPGFMNSMGGGNNPFGQFHNRLRGLSSFSGENQYNGNINTAEPLIVVDGIPNADISLLDPLNITSMKVIKDGTAAKYGMRGASGVIEINTNEFQQKGIQYHTYLGIDQLHQTMQFLDANAYKAAPGANDLGALTDWFSEVSRKSISQAHQLTLADKLKQTKYQITLNYRDAKGILKNQGFDRWQLNASIQQKAFENRLQLTAQIRGSSQDNNYSQPLAFRYAQVYNPTSSIYEEGNERFDGYAQQVLFDYYNPVAMLEQNEHLGKQSNIFTNLSASFDIFPQLQLIANYGQENRQAQSAQYSDKKSFWLGENRNGWAAYDKSYIKNQFLDTHLGYEHDLGPINGKFQAGYQYQSIIYNGFNTQTGDFLTDVFSFNNLSAAADYANGRAIINSFKNKHQLEAYYTNAQFNWKNAILINAGLRLENASRLGNDVGFGKFPYFAIDANLDNLLGGFFRQNEVQIRASYGISGNQPYADYLSQQVFDVIGQNFYYNGEYIESYGLRYDKNPKLKWEEKKEWNLGFNFSPTLFGNWSKISFDVYQSKITDIIRPSLINDLGREYYGNIGGLKNKGVEITLDLSIITNINFKWNSKFLWSHNKTILTNYSNAPSFSETSKGLGFATARGCCKANSVLLKEGETIGSFWLLKALGINADGTWNFLDIDKNGFQNEADKQVVGNGLPNWIFGWNNDIYFDNFKLNLFFRGAFGHDNFNITRKLAENRNQISAYNVMPSAFEGEIARITAQPQESSYYVENASFLRLGNATLSYQFNLSENRFLSNLQVYTTGQNLFTISGYKGWDSDYRLQIEDDVFAIGYEHRAIYLPTKSFVFGLKLGLK